MSPGHSVPRAIGDQPVELWVGVLEVLDGLYEPEGHRHWVAVPNFLRGVVAVAIA